ncbi:MAG: glycosyltransferase, partial [Bacteroidetes bacterium]|nr:glycosyltransferase [Bacteroidota bacterium]
MDAKLNKKIDTQNVTLLVGTFKQPKLLMTTLTAMVNQTYTNIKIIVIDDNSMKDTEIIEETKLIVRAFEDSRIEYIKNDFNIGVPFVFRKWISMVESKYFYLTGAGDQLMPDAIESMVTFLEDNNNASMVHGLEIKGNGEREKSLFNETCLVETKPYLKYHLLGGKKTYSWSQSSALFRTEFWRTKNIPIIHDHYWDYYFHCSYILFSTHIGYLNLLVASRETEKNDNYENNLGINSFLIETERVNNALKFIIDHEVYMLLRGYPTAIYKIKIANRLLKQGIRNQNINQSLFCIGRAFQI